LKGAAPGYSAAAARLFQSHCNDEDSRTNSCLDRG
jgi:hypothetical protein